MRRSLIRAFFFAHHFATKPILNLIAGVILFCSGLSEMLEGLTDWTCTQYLGAHHGVFVFGILQVIKALPETMRGLRFIDDGEGVLRRPADFEPLNGSLTGGSLSPP